LLYKDNVYFSKVAVGQLLAATCILCLMTLLNGVEHHTVFLQKLSLFSFVA